MKSYVGQTRSAVLVRRLVEHGVGECTVRGELLSRKRDPWFYDNGAYRDFKAGVASDELRWPRDQRRMRIDIEYGVACPDFNVGVDVVADAEATFTQTRAHRDEMAGPAYLAVQNGMTTESVERFFAESLGDYGQTYEGVFVGGSLEWKLETSAAWVRYAHATGRRCHVGRVGPGARVTWARNIGADSIESCLPLMHEKHMVAFLGALAA